MNARAIVSMIVALVVSGSNARDVGAQAPTIKVEVRTLKILSGTRNEAMPGVEVRLGSRSIKTDDRGRGSIMVEPGPVISSVTAPCPVFFISVTGSVSRTSGSNQQPIFDFPTPSTQTPTITFQMRCDGDVTPGKARVKIVTTASCKDDPNGGMSVQGGVTVMIGDKQYTSNEKGIIDVDIPPGRYPIAARWEDYALGYVTQNSLRVRGNDGGPPTVDLTDQIETLEVRMFTCDNEGREKVRAEIQEIGSSASIDVRRSNASGKGFVGMKLRDGDMVTIRGTAKLKWLGRGEIRFDEPSGHTVIKIGPGEAPAGQAARYRPGFIDLLKGVGKFFLPPDDPDAVYDENGNRLRFRITGPNAKVFIKGTTFSLSHDELRNTTSIAVHEGVVEVEPVVAGQRPFDLTAGQRAEIGPNGVAGPPISGEQTELIRTSSPTYAPNEVIQVIWNNERSYGWDWIVIVEPGKTHNASGPHSAIDQKRAEKVDKTGSNDVRPRAATTVFEGLPAGDYEARYISWDRGNNVPIGKVSFRVGAVGPITTPSSPGPIAPSNPPAAPRWNLTGLWRNPGGDGVYRVRQIDAKVVWGLDATSVGSVANMFQGQMAGDHIDGVWEDLPGSPTIGGGRMLLRVESECRFVRVSSVNRYGADVWVKKDSPCDRQAGGGSGSPVTALGTLSGLWRNPGGDAIYRFRHVGSKLHWGVDAVPIGSFANTFLGEVTGNTIEGSWLDLPGSPAISGGKLTLKIESECRIVKIGEAGHYAAQVWVRKDSLCDAGGQQQAAANPSKPKVEAIPEPDIRATTPPRTATNRPRVEEIPEDTTAVRTNSPRPKVEEIPEGEIKVTSSDGVFAGPKPTTPARAQPQPKQQPTPKPKKEGPGFWERLGTAINQAATQQQPAPTGGVSQPQPQPQRQPDGSCRGGSYWIGAPASPRTTGFQIPWSMPFGSGGHHWRVYRAGTSQHVTDNDQPANTNACGLSWHFYLPVGQFDIYLFPGTFANTMNMAVNPVAGPIRVVVSQ